jgi:hypothetical protein
VDIAQGERAEVDAFIERRSRKDPYADKREELWKASVAAYNARREEEVRSSRVEHHRGQAVRLRTVLEALITRHEEQAAKLMEAQPKGAS